MQLQRAAPWAAPCSPEKPCFANPVSHAASKGHKPPAYPLKSGPKVPRQRTPRTAWALRARFFGWLLLCGTCPIRAALPTCASRSAQGRCRPRALPRPEPQASGCALHTTRCLDVACGAAPGCRMAARFTKACIAHPVSHAALGGRRPPACPFTSWASSAPAARHTTRVAWALRARRRRCRRWPLRGNCEPLCDGHYT